MAITDAQRTVIEEYAELVSAAYNKAETESQSIEIAGVVASHVAQMLVPATMQDYARALAGKPTIQVGPSLVS